MDNRTVFAMCGLASILIITMWAHDDGYNQTLAQAKAQQEAFRDNLARIELE